MGSRSESDKGGQEDPCALLITVDDFENIARSRLTKSAYDYYRGGADDEFTLRRNIKAFNKFLIRPRVLQGSSMYDLSTRVLDGSIRLKSPICIAPTSSHKLAHSDGELATVRAASKMGTLMIASTIATTSLERIAEGATKSNIWFQLYVYKNRSATENLIKRVEKTGYSALVLTVDVAISGQRRRDIKNAFAWPPNLRMENFQDDLSHDHLARAMNKEVPGESGFANYVNELFDGSITWSVIDWLRTVTTLPIILKGILTAEDATKACKQHGIKGIIVSNHGARQLDYVPSTIEALPAIVKAVGHCCEIYFDGGIRSGTSAFKALALGAKAVFVGRPILWGLAAKGEEGVCAVLKILNEELRRTMALAGCRNIDDLRNEKNLIVHESYFSRL